MKEIVVRDLSNTNYKEFLASTSPLVTIADINDPENNGRGLDILLAFEMTEERKEDLKDVEYPVKWEEGDFIIFDFPFKYPVYLTLLECYTVYDLVTQIQDFLYDAFHSKESDNIKDGVNYEKLLLTKLTICKTGDVIAYVEEDLE